MSPLHELPDESLKGTFETVAQLARTAKPIIEGHGVQLVERAEHNEAGQFEMLLLRSMMAPNSWL
jgi:hypothetical protein